MEKAMIPIIDAFKSQNIYLKRYISLSSSQTSKAVSCNQQAVYPRCPLLLLTACRFYGGADGGRTHDLQSAILALSQLSYSPT